MNSFQMKKPLLAGAPPRSAQSTSQGAEAQWGGGRFHPHPLQVRASGTLSLPVATVGLGCGGVKPRALQAAGSPYPEAHRVLAGHGQGESRSCPRGPRLETPVRQSHGKALEKPGRARSGRAPKGAHTARGQQAQRPRRSWPQPAPAPLARQPPLRDPISGWLRPREG